MKFQLLASVTTVACLLASTAFGARAPIQSSNINLATRDEVAASTQEEVAEAVLADALTNFFEAVDAIPDDVLLAGDQATDAWLDDSGYRVPKVGAVDPVAVRDIIPADLNPRSIGDKIRCGIAVAELLSSATPVGGAAKLRKIKDLVKKAGGVKKVVKAILKGTSKKKLIKAGGKVLWELWGLFTNYEDIKEYCT